MSISVITIKGTDCRLVELGKMADKTGGQVSFLFAKLPVIIGFAASYFFLDE